MSEGGDEGVSEGGEALSLTFDTFDSASNGGHYE